MFKSWSIKKYGYKLHHKLINRYGVQLYFTVHQVRATVYQCNFNPKFLPLAYILYLSPEQLAKIIAIEFPELSIASYKKEMLTYLGKNKSMHVNQIINQA